MQKHSPLKHVDLDSYAATSEYVSLTNGVRYKDNLPRSHMSSTSLGFASACLLHLRV